MADIFEQHNLEVIKIDTMFPLSEEETIKTVMKAGKEHPNAYGCRINGTFHHIPRR